MDENQYVFSTAAFTTDGVDFRAGCQKHLIACCNMSVFILLFSCYHMYYGKKRKCIPQCCNTGTGAYRGKRVCLIWKMNERDEVFLSVLMEV